MSESQSVDRCLSNDKRNNFFVVIVIVCFFFEKARLMRAYATHIVAYRRQAMAEPLLDRAQEFVNAQRDRIGSIIYYLCFSKI